MLELVFLDDAVKKVDAVEMHCEALSMRERSWEERVKARCPSQPDEQKMHILTQNVSRPYIIEPKLMCLINTVLKQENRDLMIKWTSHLFGICQIHVSKHDSAVAIT